uniref:uncharacterized protein LOC129519580 isoform X2 n=1 Tax=Nyctereutes procyonoides TaxID=34880 RepID=UPI0024438E5B|nr:uncharacterized protein LOC129519580 isoform X2 [Nyctereutes procyonoides]
MQPLEVGLVPAPAREPRLSLWLRRGSGILAHLVALGFTIFLTALSRPGTSECAGRGGRGRGRGGAGRLDPWRGPAGLRAWWGGAPRAGGALWVFSPGTLYSWPWRSASAWPRPSCSSRLNTPCSSSAPERPGSDSTGRDKP